MNDPNINDRIFREIVLVEAVFRDRHGSAGPAAPRHRRGPLLLPLQPQRRQVLEDPAALETSSLLLKLPENFSFLATFVATNKFFSGKWLTWKDGMIRIS